MVINNFKNENICDGCMAICFRIELFGNVGSVLSVTLNFLEIIWLHG